MDTVKRKAEDDVIETVELSDSSEEEAQPVGPKKRDLKKTASGDSGENVVFLDSDCESDGKETGKDEPGVLKVDTMNKLLKEFILITKSDSNIAQFFLSQHDWKLEVAVNDFMSLSGEILNDKNNSQLANSMKNEPWAKNLQSSSEVLGAFSFISWNIDGLDKRNLGPRTANLTRILKEESPDVVFLQEVVPETIDELKSNLQDYKFLVQDYEKNMSEAYFVATLLKKNTVKVLEHIDRPFNNTVMMRGLLSTEIEIAGIKMWLLNTHLESTANYKQARVAQLQMAFKEMKDKCQTHHVLFAGDLNLRDAEVGLAGDIPSGAVDLWEACDKRDTCKYTWDSSRNSNIQLGSFSQGSSSRQPYKPRLRFDRAYLGTCKGNSNRPLAVHFGLVGIEKVPNRQCYTSDHWGLQVQFTINKP
ncbi:tyrosyl-DNA phosphodiesterase 2-like [Cloeon dipterum]|uniref:tyrosyl-DNA phosphodiesterase 2-like n=1 Tax=Cloeon dipterum TaxID=197152 RepID=UPI00321FD07E